MWPTVGMRRLLASAAAVLALAGCTIGVSGSPAEPTRISAEPSSSPTPVAGRAPPLSTTMATSATSSGPSSVRSTVATHRTKSLTELRDEHDSSIDAILATLSRDLIHDQRADFLQHFDPKLTHRVAAWFDNSRELGVAQARLVRMRDYYSQADDRPNSFSRSVVLGIRTPYDDIDSLPGIAYSLAMTGTPSGWRITGWKPSYDDDPMNCDCMLTVTHNTTMAVVAADRPDLQGWPRITLDAGSESVGWVRSRLPGSGLLVPRGQVIFLADAPYHWFTDADRPVERSNATISLVDAAGDFPGQDYSSQSRIVLILTDSKGDMAPQDHRGALYVADVMAHESTHQLMSRNSQLYYGGPTPIDTWVVEGIAVAVEVVHRRNHPGTEDVGYPQPDDPRNADSQWLADHVNTSMPTTAQLYSSPLPERNYWYGVAGSVFLYLDHRYGFSAMMKVAGQVYAKNNRSPFQFFPDPDHSGSYLPIAAATTSWLQWFKDQFEG